MESDYTNDGCMTSQRKIIYNKFKHQIKYSDQEIKLINTELVNSINQ